MSLLLYIMRFWLVNHSWVSFQKTSEYCGFKSPSDQEKVIVGDMIVYFGQNLVLGVFEAVALVKNEFNGWGKKYPYQVKLKLIAIAKGGLIAKNLESKILMQKSEGGSPTIVELTEIEFNQIKTAIETGQKELIFE